MRRKAFAIAVACLFFLGSGATAAAKDKAKQAMNEVKELERNCDAGNHYDCYRLGFMFSNDARSDDVPRDYARAVSLFQKACDGEYADGCIWLGRCYEHGYGVPKDATIASSQFELASSLLEHACNLGDTGECFAAARIHHPLEGNLKDATRWAMFMEKCCDRGWWRGELCLKVGLAYDIGLWIPKDPDHAAELFKKGCFHGNKRACDLIER